MQPRVGIVGTGKIARHLDRRLAEREWEVLFTSNRREYVYPTGGGYAWDGHGTASERAEHLLGTKPDLVFLAISTNDQGQDAFGYITTFVNAGIPVVTCEKGALAHYDLSARLPYLGFTAAVGGGTQMLRYLADRRPISTVVEINGVFNGTLNYIFHQVSAGATLATACEEAKELHITEPGADDPLSIVNAEMGDIVRKICVLYNSTLSTREILVPERFGKVGITSQELERLSKSAGSYRMIVSLCNTRPVNPDPFFGQGYGVVTDRWDIRFGFRRVLNESEFDWLPGGVGNGLCITEGYLGKGGKYVLLGPGAGLEPTTTAMLNDAYRLLESCS